MEYFSPDLAEIQRKAQQIMQRERLDAVERPTTLQWYKWDSGLTRHVLRICPPWSAERKWFVERQKHFNVPGTSWTSIPCPTPCSICAVLADLERTVHKDYLKRFRLTRSAVFNAIVRGREQLGIYAVELPSGAWRDLLALIIASDVELAPFDPSDQGLDIVIDRTGSGKDTRLSVAIAEQPSPLGVNLTNIPDLNAALSPGFREVQEARSVATAIKAQFTATLPPPPSSEPPVWERTEHAEKEVPKTRCTPPASIQADVDGEEFNAAELKEWSTKRLEEQKELLTRQLYPREPWERPIGGREEWRRLCLIKAELESRYPG